MGEHKNKDWYIKKSSDLTKQYGDVPPPWIIVPNAHPYSIGWRMGSGETHIMVLSEWLDQKQFSLEERITYLHKYPAPPRWYDWIIHFLWKTDTIEFEKNDYQPYLEKLTQLGFKNTNDFFSDMEREDLE